MPKKILLLISLSLVQCSTLPKSDLNQLLVAAARNDIATIDRWINQSEDLNYANENGTTALMTAAHRGHNAAVERLLQGGANPNQVDQQGQSALHYASFSAAPGPCQLLAAKTSVEVRADHDGLTPLILASRFGTLDCVHALLAAGHDVNDQEPMGWPALFYAIARGQVAYVNTLLDAGADLTLVSKEGDDALSIAALYQQKAIEQILKSRIDKKVRPR